MRDWLSQRAENPLARLALLWFRRYFEASRNSGVAASAYITLSVVPAALVIVAFFNLARGDEHAFADRLITHMKLNGSDKKPRPEICSVPPRTTCSRPPSRS